ncbi:MAG TPA: twin-arginine translocase subunit TatC [Candidatus Eisenbacteria bacterium]|jgi:sec-independent protein translocase protein TatC
MSFLEHLDDLRSGLVRAGFVALLLMVAAWAMSGRLIDGLILHLLHGQRVLTLTPTESFQARIQVALWTGGAASLPYLLWEAWRFVAPGLQPQERRFAIPWLLASALLLYAGIAFSVEVLLPVLVTTLQGFATPQIESRIALLSLLSFAIKLSFGCGLLFQIPLVLCLLSWFGIVSPRALARQWRHAILFIALAAAVVTPGDGPSMLILSAPIVVLYFLSLIVAWLLWRARRRGGAEPGDLWRGGA